jgi:hypothetical protein
VKKLVIVVYIVELVLLIKRRHAWDVDQIIKNKIENQNGVAKFVDAALN